MFIALIRRIILLSLASSFSLIGALNSSTWHVLHTVTDCSRAVMMSPEFFCKYAPTVATILHSTKVIDSSKPDIEYSILDEGCMHQIYSYSLNAKNFALYCTILPLNSMVTVNVYCKQDAYNRDSLSEFTRNFFCARMCSHTTQYLMPIPTQSHNAPNK